MELALSLEKLNFQKLRHLHDVADKSEDAQMSDFVEDMLADQVTVGCCLTKFSTWCVCCLTHALISSTIWFDVVLV